MRQLICIRHGQTVWNTSGRLQGQLDSPLSPLGIRQAQAVVEGLKKYPKFEVIYSSPLGRAFSTAQIIANNLGYQGSIHLDKGLAEWDVGVFQGLTSDEIREKYPDEWTHFSSGDAEFVIPSGESAIQKDIRVIKSVEEIIRNYQIALVVAHGGVINAIFQHVLNIPTSRPKGYQIQNASISTFHFDNGKWLLNSWGDTLHLGKELVKEELIQF